MPDETLTTPATYTQLTQARVPLEDAADAFSTRDANDRIPIILIPQHLNRIRNELILIAIVLLGVTLFAAFFMNNGALAAGAGLLAVLFLILGVYRSFIVRVPEGVNALLMRGGRYTKTIGSGTQILPPWIVISHLVTTREIPFDVPLVESPTKNNVRANVDTLMTFRITDPYKFVYNISANDFDHVFQAACQDGLRSTVRRITSEQVLDLKKADLVDVVEMLSTAVDSYGVSVTNINVTYAQPPAEFMQSQEARQLAILQQKEQEERQRLAQHRQTDADALARQKVIANVEREKENLQRDYQTAEAQHHIIELEAKAEALRLAKLQERLENYPQAAEFDVETNKLEIARALAGNTRAMLQIGQADDIVRAFVMRDILQDIPQTADNGE
ncbi:MAG: hypothetical protein GY796_20215 [Chloroflexi bacterium]|nr:hypothetical protein [Chloroflexota bacterium]